MNTKPIILKIGGSLLSRSDEVLFDMEYMMQLRALLLKLVAQGYKLVINVGGGYVTRKYQKFLAAGGEGDSIDLHWVGIACTNLNAEVFRGLMSDVTVPQILRYEEYERFLQDPHTDYDFGDKSILMISSAKPGRSNDWNALQFALNLGIDTVIDIKNIDAVYTADPTSDPAAQKLPKLTWTEYLDVIGNPAEQAPGASYPVDPIAAREAHARNVRFLIVGGIDMANLEAAIMGQEFSGTVISG